MQLQVIKGLKQQSHTIWFTVIDYYLQAPWKTGLLVGESYSGKTRMTCQLGTADTQEESELSCTQEVRVGRIGGKHVKHSAGADLSEEGT